MKEIIINNCKYVSFNIPDIDNIKAINLNKIGNPNFRFIYNGKGLFEYGNSKWIVSNLFCNRENSLENVGSETGWVILKDGVIVYAVFIYEPQYMNVNVKRGLATFTGHEEIIQLWLDDGEYKRDYTR